MTRRYGTLVILFVVTAIQSYIDKSKITLAEIDMNLIFVGMLILGALEDSRR